MFYYLLFLHYIGDFILQDRKIAMNKSSNFNIMFDHCMIIFLVLFLGLNVFCYNFKNIWNLCVYYSLIHFLQDTFVWRSYKWIMKKKLKNRFNDFKYWESSGFYSTIGLDQMLHIATLFFLYRMFL